MSPKAPRLALLCMALLGVVGLYGCHRDHDIGPEAHACAALKQLHLEHVQIVSSVYHSAGREISLTTTPMGIPWFQMPASCRVKIIIAPTSDSHIESEVWMPSTEWNGRLWSVGNGGLAGSIDEIGMSLALTRGYATSATDTGHKGKDTDGAWALGHPEKITDFGHRAIHETALQAKALVQALLGRKPDFSYFAGGSNGGREALQEAQRYPEDYDGIESGAPAFDGSNNLVSGSWMEHTMTVSKNSWVPPDKLKALEAASIAACDAVDGLKDGLIDDPRRCEPKPESLACKGTETQSCLTPAQIESVKSLYQGPGGEDPNHFRYYGYEPGGEAGWSEWSLASDPHKSVLYRIALEFHRNLVYDNAAWNMNEFDLRHDDVEADRRMGPAYDARDADLSRFAARGGKLILFHGWSDQALQPRLTIDYYQRVQSKAGADAAAHFVALYMVPGMWHVIGGPGPNAFGQLTAPPASATPANNIGSALQAWVEKGQRPGSIIAGKYDNDIKAILVPDQMHAMRTRPLCPYPQVARWKGGGSIEDANNFSCTSL
jgi:Tannase and feruloyl esterase